MAVSRLPTLPPPPSEPKPRDLSVLCHLAVDRLIGTPATSLDDELLKRVCQRDELDHARRTLRDLRRQAEGGANG
jgi:hypothetical protein